MHLLGTGSHAISLGEEGSFWGKWFVFFLRLRLHICLGLYSRFVCNLGCSQGISTKGFVHAGRGV